MKKFFSNNWPIFVILFLVFIFFWKFFLKGLIPMPADITVGVYFPWLDYHWGFPTGVPVKNPLPSDIPSLLYPWRLAVIDSLKNHTWPLWNPFYFGGMPLLANFQSATFLWTNILFFFLSFTKAWSWGIVVQPFLTIVFTFIFLRHLKLNKIASLLGGIVFAFSAFSLVWMEYNVHGHTAMWLPLLLLATDMIIESRQLKWVLAGGLFLALSIFAGYPQIVFYSMTAVGFYALFRLFEFWQEEKSFKKTMISLFLLFVFVILGGLLSAVQWLPGYEALKLSVREIDPIASFSAGGFLPYQNLVTFFSPDFFGSPATYNFWGQAWYDNFALYVGILPLFLAFLAIFSRKKEVWFFTFLAIFALLLALPTPIGKWFADTGLYGVKSISARIIFLLDFSLAILAAFGLDLLISDKKWVACAGGPPSSTRSETRMSDGGKHATGPILVFLTFTIVFLGLWGFVFLATRFFPQAAWLINLSIAKRNLILPTALFLASSVVLISLIFSQKRLASKVLRFTYHVSLIALFLLVVLDLFRFGWKYLSFSKPELVFPVTPVIEFLQKQEKPLGVNFRGEPFRVEFGEVIPQNMWMPYGLESAAGYDAMAPLRYNQFLGAVLTGKINTPYGRIGQVENYDNKLFDFLNIKYVLAVKYDAQGIRNPEGKPKPIFQNKKFKLVFEDKSVQVYENKNALPRAFLVHDWVVEKDDQKIIDLMLSPGFDLNKKAILEEEIPLVKPIVNKAILASDQINYLVDKPQEKIIETNSLANSLLVVGDNFYPGWQVTIDGKTAKIYRANYNFRGVIVPAGEHKVVFKYEPLSFKIGLYISSVTLILFLAGTVIFWRRKII